MKHKLTFIGVFFLATLSVFSCKDDEKENLENQKIKDQELIEQFLLDNNLTASKTASGLHHIVVEEGTGAAHPTLSSQVEVKYKGSLLSKQVFDQSPENKTVKFGLSQVIVGWQEGLQLMKSGGKSILIIPSYMGYGARSLPGIPANSVLVFDVELVGFN